MTSQHTAGPYMGTRWGSTVHCCCSCNCSCSSAASLQLTCETRQNFAGRELLIANWAVYLRIKGSRLSVSFRQLSTRQQVRLVHEACGCASSHLSVSSTAVLRRRNHFILLLCVSLQGQVVRRGSCCGSLHARKGVGCITILHLLFNVSRQRH